MQKHRLLEQALPSLFPFSLPPPPPLFAPATQATVVEAHLQILSQLEEQNEIEVLNIFISCSACLI